MDTGTRYCMWYWVVHCQVHYTVVTAVSVYIHSPVHETRNNVMTVLICNSAELRRRMFYSVSLTCLVHDIWSYFCVVYDHLSLEWLRLVVLRFVRQAFVSAMCPWFGIRFCHCLSYTACILFLSEGFPSCLGCHPVCVWRWITLCRCIVG